MWSTLALLAGYATLFEVVESLCPVVPARFFRKGWFTDLLHFFVSWGLIQVGSGIALGLLAMLLHGAVSPVLQSAVSSQPIWLQCVEAVLIGNLGFYVAHRLCHAVPWLWHFHAVHHSTEQLDWRSAARQHPVDAIFVHALQFVLPFVLGLRPEALGAFAALSAAHVMWIHANHHLGPTWLDRWIVTPRFHHWHHARDVQDKNFAVQLAFLDTMFGTAHLPDTYPRSTGCADRVPDGYLGQLLHPVAVCVSRPPL
jgi:sterol desaturase/sphingolipid hydroxylase (fatty acid hydroxylase superfamily)